MRKVCNIKVRQKRKKTTNDKKIKGTQKKQTQYMKKRKTRETILLSILRYCVAVLPECQGI